jgi:hypothetical protein
MTIRAVPTSLSRSARHDYGICLERAHLFTAVEDVLGAAAGLSSKGVHEVFSPHPPEDSASSALPEENIALCNRYSPLGRISLQDLTRSQLNDLLESHHIHIGTT